ncbi:efflux RND transporter periplasmic adaptor subunit [Bacillus sp. FJAT-45350]|uniref:efflux RND transporter periplasmic adaptor subunit n=1 Tax=Bacillus sp. FJAT-45350 TaxID=2011014 RepID=UPI000BB6B029|nr:efflux RND transporter periplasmic adaptor subunit [Bacillus sp. FJAT-45350]
MKKVLFILFIIFLTACQTNDITNDEVERQSILVETATVSKETIEKTLELNGQALPANQLPLFTPTPLTVEQVHKTVGDEVSKDDLIISLDDQGAKRQLNLARNVVTELEKALSQANQLRKNTEQNITKLQQQQNELEQSLKQTQKLLSELGDEDADVSLVEFVRSSLELSLKQAELQQSAGSMQQIPSINTLELETQLTSARENVRQAELALEMTKLRSPINGVIALLDVTEGQTAIPNSPLVMVVELDPVVATFTANSFQVAQLTRGMDALLTINGIEEQLQGTISVVSPVINPQTNSFTVEIPVDNTELKIKGGMKATAHIKLGTIEEALMVPLTAILYDDLQPYVYVVNEGTVTRTNIIIGMRNEDMIEVVDGLSAEDIIVTTGKERLTEGVEITIRSE